jgi:hypothetical protein
MGQDCLFQPGDVDDAGVYLVETKKFHEAAGIPLPSAATYRSPARKRSKSMD